MNYNSVETALNYIPANCEREMWRQCLAAVKTELGEEGRDLARDWSANGDSYNSGDFAAVWKSLEPGHYHFATLAHYAKANGWAEPHGGRMKRANGRPHPKATAASDETSVVLRRKNAETKAAALLSKLDHSPATDDHPYLVRKGVRLPAPTIFQVDSAAQLKPIIGYAPKLDGNALEGRILVVPIYSAHDPHHLTSLEFIDEAGRKVALAGGAKSGGVWTSLLDDLVTPDGVHNRSYVVIAEGVATALSICMATGAQTFAALTCTNLVKVAKELRAQYPKVSLVIAGDIGNGSADAAKAAKAVGGFLAMPEFGNDRHDDQTDFNDLHQACGLDAVRTQLEAALQPHAKADSSAQDDAQAGTRTETDDQAITRLAKLSAIQYERIRIDEAQRLAIRPAMLDKLVKAEREKGADSDAGTGFEDIEPHDLPVDGVDLLNEIARTVRRFIVCDRHTVAAVTLWIAATWFVDSVQVCPLLMIDAPEKACGKSHLLTIVGRLALRPAQAAGITPSVLFRMIERYQPTLLVDEIETVLTREAEDLRGLFNAGHTRDSAFVWRSVAKGDDFEPRRFGVFGFKAIAGINAHRLAETVTSRSIIATLRKKLPDEKVERLRHAPAQLFPDLSAKLARWSLDHSGAMRAARPALPDALSDRSQDNWEPLLAVADLAGSTWAAYAREAALALCADDEGQSPSIGAQLLNDIRDVFTRKKTDRLHSHELAGALCDLEESPWGEWQRGKGLTARNLSRLLAEYKVRSLQIKIAGENQRGYLLSDFADAFKRYAEIS